MSDPLTPMANVMSWLVVLIGPTPVPGPNDRVKLHVVALPAIKLTLEALNLTE
jgi:hypothetical protein